MRKTPSKPLALVGLSVLIAPSVLGVCTCTHPNEGETTHWGGNEVIEEKRETSYRKLEGTVEYLGDRPLANALVEIFDHPELMEQAESKRSASGQRRLAACRTAADGKFCFRNLPSGKYELRSSLDSGWNVTHVYVVVDKKAGQGKRIQVQMSVGT